MGTFFVGKEFISLSTCFLLIEDNYQSTSITKVPLEYSKPRLLIWAFWTAFIHQDRCKSFPPKIIFYPPYFGLRFSVISKIPL